MRRVRFITSVARHANSDAARSKSSATYSAESSRPQSCDCGHGRTAGYPGRPEPGLALSLASNAPAGLLPARAARPARVRVKSAASIGSCGSAQRSDSPSDRRQVAYRRSHWPIRRERKASRAAGSMVANSRSTRSKNRLTRVTLRLQAQSTRAALVRRRVVHRRC
jgi:hypothetical protein